MRKRSAGFWTACVVLALVSAGLLQRLTGVDLNWLLIYAMLVAWGDWAVGSPFGLLFSVLALALWLLGGGVPLHTGSWLVFAWNLLSGFCTLLAANLILWLWRKTPAQVALAARTDPLTGLFNRRAFTEIGMREILRCRRHERMCTIACFDVDGFKRVNADNGHADGDRLLAIIGHTFKEGVRTSDIAARLEGDSFALLLPEMNEQTTRLALERIQSLLHETAAHAQAKVTLRVGAVAFKTLPKTSEDFLTQLDRLRFTVKAAPKASLRIQVV